MGVKTFNELAAWQRADELRTFVQEVTARPDVARDRRFCEQCKAAARSAPNNIAEGFGRYHHKEFAQFVRVALGSLQEVRDQMAEAYKLRYITEAEMLGVETTIKRAVASCTGLERYLRSTTAPPSRST
ncbi:MAG: four helix bundle protein [Vicinamibacterales bacterium]